MNDDITQLGKLIVQTIKRAEDGKSILPGTLKGIEEGFSKLEQRLRSVESHFIRYGAPPSDGAGFD